MNPRGAYSPDNNQNQDNKMNENGFYVWLNIKEGAIVCQEKTERQNPALKTETLIPFSYGEVASSVAIPMEKTRSVRFPNNDNF